MTEDELKAIEERANAATSGPWVHFHRDLKSNELGKKVWENSPYPEFDMAVDAVATGWNHGQLKGPVPITGTQSSPYYVDGHCQPHVCPEDADFIAHAREDIPALIAEIRRLRLRSQSWQYSSTR